MWMRLYHDIGIYFVLSYVRLSHSPSLTSWLGPGRGLPFVPLRDYGCLLLPRQSSRSGRQVSISHTEPQQFANSSFDVIPDNKQPATTSIFCERRRPLTIRSQTINLEDQRPDPDLSHHFGAYSVLLSPLEFPQHLQCFHHPPASSISGSY